MSWRNQGVTGSNNIPLGTRRRAGDGPDAGAGGYNPSQPAAGMPDQGLKRGRSPTRCESVILTSDNILIVDSLRYQC